MRWSRSNDRSGSTLFALILVALWIGCLVGNWLPVADLDGAASVRSFEIAILFLFISVMLTWLEDKWSARSVSSTGDIRQLWRRMNSPESRAELTTALNEHLKGDV